jgi:hypothetical protein
MTINIGELAAGVRSIKLAGEPIVAHLEAAGARTDEVWKLLGPHAYREVGLEARTLVPQETLTRIDGLLGEALEHQAAARTAIDDAFGAGTWMSDLAREEHAFTTEVRTMLADPRLGPDSADTARSLLGSNSFARGEAIDGLERGMAEKLADPEMFQYVKHMDYNARAKAEAWRSVWGASA